MTYYCIKKIVVFLIIMMPNICYFSQVNANDDSVDLNDNAIVKITDYIPDIVVNLKYATTDNFTGKIIYRQDMPACLRYGTVKKLQKASGLLKEKGYFIVIWDAFRPVSCQYKLWEVCPNPVYVANPREGYSNHSRGNAVDISIVGISGEIIAMPTGFDNFTEKADRDYSDVESPAKENALMLENIMKECGFKAYFGEWWHFSDSVSYEPYNGEI